MKTNYINQLQRDILAGEDSGINYRSFTNTPTSITETMQTYTGINPQEQSNTNYRRLALDWWNTLPFDSSNTTVSKRYYFEKYKSKVFTPAKDYSQLTGREIQNIWAVETETKDAEMIPPQIQEQSILSIEDKAKQYAYNRFGSSNETQNEWEDCQEHFIAGANEMLPIIKELGEALKMAKNFIPQYEYGQGERFETETYAKIQATLDKYKNYL